MSILTRIKNNSKVVGYFSYDDSGKVFCTPENACIISGSEELAKTYLRKMDSKNIARVTIKKIRCGEIMDAMEEGTKYAFDRESYDRFLPIARVEGMKNLLSGDVFLNEQATGLDFLTVELTGF